MKASTALLALWFVSAVAVAGAQGQAPAGRGIQPSEHPVLPIGAPLPEFALPGVDGKEHKSSDYAKARGLAVLFERVHCPGSINYEARAERLDHNYRNKGPPLRAITPTHP